MSLTSRRAPSPPSTPPLSPAACSSGARARRYESVSRAVRWRWALRLVPFQPRQVLRTEPFPREVELRQSVLQFEFQVPVLRLGIVLEPGRLWTHCLGREAFVASLLPLLPR